MKQPKFILNYIFTSISLLALIAYGVLSFIPAIKVEYGEMMTIYEYALKPGNYWILVALIAIALSILLMIASVTLSFIKKVNKKVIIFLLVVSLPLLAIGITMNIILTPVYETIKSASASNITYIFYIQNALLILALILNIALVFYIAIKTHKYRDFDHKKKKKK